MPFVKLSPSFENLTFFLPLISLPHPAETDAEAENHDNEDENELDRVTVPTEVEQDSGEDEEEQPLRKSTRSHHPSSVSHLLIDKFAHWLRHRAFIRA